MGENNTTSPQGVVHIKQDAACKELAQYLTRQDDSTDISCDVMVVIMITLPRCHPRKYSLIHKLDHSLVTVSQGHCSQGKTSEMEKRTLIFQRQGLEWSNVSFKSTKVLLGSQRHLDLHGMVGGPKSLQPAHGLLLSR